MSGHIEPYERRFKSLMIDITLTIFSPKLRVLD
jgi:hypothetical protein